MELILSIVLFLASLVVLVKSADWVTKYASKLVMHWGVSEFAIGATIVAVATSLPEIFVSLISGLSSMLDPATTAVEIASGTVIGSNIANIGLILGLAIILRPIGTDIEDIKQEKFMLFLSFLLAVLLIGGLGLTGGLAILGLTFVYVFYLLGKTRSYNPITMLKSGYYKISGRESFRDLALSMLGGVGLAVGSVMLVNSVMGLSEGLAVPKFLISLLLVALGTSLPELSASIFAAIKGMKGMSVGNIIGSNIINICALGMTALMAPIASNPELFLLEIPVMLLTAGLVLVFMRTRRGFSRLEGFILLAVYAVFVALQFI